MENGCYDSVSQSVWSQGDQEGESHLEQVVAGVRDRRAGAVLRAPGVG